ncbi:MAG TPA: cohesin domain-containing protein [Thermoanaerobaculia bacterium]|nr:cohesin domain-containing protein [Thermoanaerobaculia bacterium]
MVLSSRRFHPLLVAVLLVLAPACGGGGGGGGGTPTQPPQPAVVFQPAGAAGPGSIALGSGAASGASRFYLEVRANQVESLYGLAFDLAFPAAQLRFERATEGTVLGADGAGTTLQVAEGGAGRLVVGLSRLGAVAGVTASGTLLTLEFVPVASGSGAFAFSSNAAFDADAAPLAGVAWQAGSIEVRL